MRIVHQESNSEHDECTISMFKSFCYPSQKMDNVEFLHLDRSYDIHVDKERACMFVLIIINRNYLTIEFQNVITKL